MNVPSFNYYPNEIRVANQQTLNWVYKILRENVVDDEVA